MIQLPVFQKHNSHLFQFSINRPPISTLIAFVAEAFGTAILAFVVFALTHLCNGDDQKKLLVPPLVGACVAAVIVVIAPLTQCGINPARDFGPRIVAYLAGWGNIAFRGWWVYVFAPIMGAPIGAFVADKLLYSMDPETTEELPCPECSVGMI